MRTRSGKKDTPTDETEESDMTSTEEESTDYLSESSEPEKPQHSKNKLNVVMFANRKRKAEETDESEDDSDYVPPSGTVKKKISTKIITLARKRFRKLKKCEICGKSQRNIWRHKKMMHKEYLEPKDLQKKKSRRGYIVRICPIKRCQAVVERMRDHLVRKHKIAKNSNKLYDLLEKAKPVMEKMETPEKVEVKREIEEPEVILIESDTDTEKKKKSHIRQLFSSDSENNDSVIQQQVKVEIHQEPKDNDPVIQQQVKVEIHPEPKDNDSVIQQQVNVEIHPEPKDTFIQQQIKVEIHPEPKNPVLGLVTLVNYSDTDSQDEKSPKTEKDTKKIEIKKEYISDDENEAHKDFMPPENNLKKYFGSESNDTDDNDEYSTTPAEIDDRDTDSNSENDLKTLIKQEYNSNESDEEKQDSLSSERDLKKYFANESSDESQSEVEYVSDISEDRDQDQEFQSTQRYVCEPYVSDVDNSTDKSCNDSEDDSIDEEAEVAQNQEETAKLDTNENCDTKMKSFLQWMQEFPFLKSYRTSLQHARQAFQYWKYATGNLTIQGFFEITCLNGWIVENLKFRTPGTLRSYLSSVRYFVDFAIYTNKVRDEAMPRALRFKEQISVISKSLAKRVRQRRTVVETNEIQTMLLPADFQEFIQSDISNECKGLLLGDELEELNPVIFVKLRDYLILRIMQANAQRPMAVRNITEDSMDKAKRNEDGGCVIMIAEHKTAEKGPVSLALNSELFKMLKNYVQLCNRIPIYHQDKRQSIFFTWQSGDTECNTMSSSLVNKSVQRIWSKGPVEKKINATRIRKATTTAVRSVYPKSREVLARHMGHAAETADRYYSLHDQQQLAGPVSQMIQEVMMDNDNRSNIKNSVHWPKEKSSVVDEDADKSVQQNKVDHSDIESDIAPPQSPLYDLNVTSDSELSKTPVHKRRTFNDDDAKKLLRLCSDNLENNKITKSDIMVQLQSTNEGKCFLLELKEKLNVPNFWKVVVDRIHAERRRRQRKSLR